MSDTDVIVAEPMTAAPRATETPDLAALSLGSARWIGQVFAQSGFFKDARQEAQAITKVIAGQEIGLKPMQAMTNIHVFDGKVTLGASLIGMLIKRSGTYRYSVEKLDRAECVITIMERFEDEWVIAGTAGFTFKEAEHAGLTTKNNWRNYPEDMLFARAISRAARRYCPDVFGGSVMSTEEMRDEGYEVSSGAEARQAQLDEQAADLAALDAKPRVVEVKVPKPRASRKTQDVPAGESPPVPQAPVGASSAGESSGSQEAEPQEELTPPPVDLSPPLGDSPAEPSTPSVTPPVAPAEPVGVVSQTDPVQSGDAEAVNERIKRLATIIGVERTTKGYDRLRESIGMVAGETYSTHAQVVKILAGLDTAIKDLTPKAES